MPTETPKWTLFLGIHRGTLTSRDSEPPKPLDSLEECEQQGKTALQEYERLGCQCWYCYAISPTGERHTIVKGQPYA